MAFFLGLVVTDYCMQVSPPPPPLPLISLYLPLHQVLLSPPLRSSKQPLKRIIAPLTATEYNTLQTISNTIYKHSSDILLCIINIFCLILCPPSSDVLLCITNIFLFSSRTVALAAWGAASSKLLDEVGIYKRNI